MANWYTTRTAVKRAANLGGGLYGQLLDDAIDRQIEAASRLCDNLCNRWFIPRTETRLYRWPQINGLSGTVWLDADLIAVTALLSEAQNSSPTTIAGADYFVEPVNHGPPYTRIEIDLSSSAAFSGGDTPQRSISVAGRWGYGEDTVTAGTVSSGLASSASATSAVVSDGSLVDVGDTLLCESEQLFVTQKRAAALGSILMNDTLTADPSDDVLTVDGSHGIVAGEELLIESERMLVLNVSTNDLTVKRGFDGTTVASHANDTAVQIYRTLTVVRAINGTTAVTHANSTALTKYQAPADVRAYVLAKALSLVHQDMAAWGRSIGGPDGAVEFRGGDLMRLEKTVKDNYQRRRPYNAI